jgi:hypothetical protein
MMRALASRQNDLTFSEARRIRMRLHKQMTRLNGRVFVVHKVPSAQNWRHHGQEEIEATRMDPRRRSRIEKPRQAKDPGDKNCSEPQANGRCDSTEGVQLRGVTRFACLAHDPEWSS